MLKHVNNQVVIGADSLTNVIIMKWSLSGDVKPLEQPAHACKDCPLTADIPGRQHVSEFKNSNNLPR